ncbi:MAG: hypothetical protein R3D80_18660 [Paracoccaceae bacterium]
MRQVFDLADRIVVFRRGRICANLTRDQTDPQDIVQYITGAKTGEGYRRRLILPASRPSGRGAPSRLRPGPRVGAHLPDFVPAPCRDAPFINRRRAATRRKRP